MLQLCYWAQPLSQNTTARSEEEKISTCSDGYPDPLLNIFHNTIRACVTNQNWSLLLAQESGIQTLLAKMWSGAKGLQEKALKHFLPTVTQLLLHPGVPLVFNLLIMAIMASSDPAYPFPSLLHLDGLIIFTSHNTLLKIWSLLQNYHKKKPLPACCFLSAVQASSSTVSASQHETLCCLL